MKIQGIFVAMVYRKKEPTPFKLDNGAEGLSYKVIVDDFTSTAEIKVTEEVYNVVKPRELCLLGYEYDTEAALRGRRSEIKINKLYAVLDTDKELITDDIVRYCVNGFNAEKKTEKK